MKYINFGDSQVHLALLFKKKNGGRSQQDSHLHGETRMDFWSIALTTQP